MKDKLAIICTISGLTIFSPIQPEEILFKEK